MYLSKSKTHNSDYMPNRINIILVFIFLTLLFLHGEHYVQCRSIHPDEIMDLQCSALPKISSDDQGFKNNSENRKYKQLFSSIKIKISSIFNDSSGKIPLVNELQTIKDLNDRLSTLQRYKS